jgi:tripeptidyl-peptidase-1
MGQTQNIPMVNSISYGWWEGDQCTISPSECQQIGVNSYGYVGRVNTEFQKIGARGITLLSASGDSGCHGRTDESCTSKTFRPDFPGASPYVLSVGGTMVTNGVPLANPPPICAASRLTCAQSGTEVAVSFAVAGYTSGGGFSNVGSMPDFQKAAVSAYLASAPNLPPATYFNQTGRAFPDVSALGHNCIIIMGGRPEPVGGTSCAAPIFGSVVSLLNQAAVKKTGKPLGYVNQLIYQMFDDDPTIFNDVTVGDNRCTESGCASACKGFYCTKGWDPITGVGTPNYPKMLAYIESHL